MKERERERRKERKRIIFAWRRENGKTAEIKLRGEKEKERGR